MSAIKDKIAWYQHLVDANKDRGICTPSLERDLAVTKEISDRLDSAETWHKTVNEVLNTHKEFAMLQSQRIDALEANAHEQDDWIKALENVMASYEQAVSAVSQSPLPVEVPPPSTLYTNDTERSCGTTGAETVVRKVLKPKQPAQADRSCDNCRKFYGCPIYNNSITGLLCDLFEPQPAQEQGGEDKIAKYREEGHPGKWWLTDFTMKQVEGRIADLRARLEQAEAENAELKRSYNELIMAVAHKFPNESRHHTALRYIVEAENREATVAAPKDKSEVK